MKHAAICITATLLATSPLAAQPASEWTDIDCGTSRIDVPSGNALRCRAAGQFTSHDQGNSGGAFRRFNAYSRADNGKTAFYLLTEASLGGYVYTNALVDSLKVFPAAKDAYGYGEPMSHNGTNFVRFMARTGESCVGARRLGPSHSVGYRWIMFGTSCAATGAKITPAQEQAFLDSMKVR